MMDEITNIAERLIHAFYNNPQDCPHLVKIVFCCTAVCAYRVIYENDNVPNQYLYVHSGEKYYIFHEIYDNFFSNDTTLSYHSDYTPQIPFDQFRYQISYGKLYDLANISMNCYFAFKTFTTDDNKPDRYADYAIVMMLLLQEYKKYHESKTS